MVLGIIAEYNPFHNGHLYHILKSKELTKDDYVIVLIVETLPNVVKVLL